MSLAVSLNDRIDYFGQQVNIATRVQQLAAAGEIVVSEHVYRDRDVTRMLDRYEGSEDSGIMKGVKEQIPSIGCGCIQRASEFARNLEGTCGKVLG